jgi:hypothetical protein
MLHPFEYRKLSDFTYHLITKPEDIRDHVMKWIMPEWESDHSQAPEEHWTVAWMNVLPRMDFKLEIVHLADIRPNADLMSVAQFQVELKERADDREESILRGMSIEPLLVNRNGYELMDGYTRYTFLQRYQQKEVYVYVGTVSE